MNIKSVYSSLPYVLRSTLASVRGFQLQRWRYGGESELLVEEALARERWTPEQWSAWQTDRLQSILEIAATRVPYYRDYWKSRRQSDDPREWAKLKNWPILSKDALRQQPESFLVEGTNTHRLRKLSTSGTTGKPVMLWRSKRTSRRWYALFEARWRRWNHVSRHDHWAILGGRSIVSPGQGEPPYWVWNLGMRQLYMSTYHISATTAQAYFDAMRDHRVTYLYGYASAMHSLAQFALEQDLRCPPMKVAISNAEPLVPHQRTTIQQAFGCPVRNTYGMAEAVAGASECEAGALHLWPDAGVLESLDAADDVPAAPGASGRLICTGLLNPDMPLIRYEVGDYGVLEQKQRTCACGRTLPILAAIEGRAGDMVVTPSGRKIGRFGTVFKAGLPLREAQVVQRSRSRLELLIVPSGGFSHEHRRELEAGMRERVGDMQIDVTLVQSIDRTATGKFKHVVNMVEDD